MWRLICRLLLAQAALAGWLITLLFLCLHDENVCTHLACTSALLSVDAFADCPGAVADAFLNPATATSGGDGEAAAAVAQEPTRPPRLAGVIGDKLCAGIWMGQAEAWARETQDFVQA